MRTSIPSIWSFGIVMSFERMMSCSLQASMQQITKIQKRYLIAIEDEKFDELPGDFYVRAFIKQYADTVGLDGKELLREYDDDLLEAKTAEYSSVSSIPCSKHGPDASG